jgi:hypothetical protein
VRIQLRRSGGFAGNIRRPPLVVDTATLPEDEAREIEALAEAVLAGPQPGGAPGGADRMRLDLAVEQERAQRSAAFEEGAAPAELRELLRRMRDRR